jgi:hypothetical protein
VLLVPGLAQAQDFGVMESAETINRGDFKLKGNPMFIIGRDDGDNETGIPLSPGFDVTVIGIRLTANRLELYGAVDFA